ncbi:MAG: carboxyl-terminal processing protease [Bacteroidia bacterium]|jgi:carboxyl-terminal processing protease
MKRKHVLLILLSCAGISLAFKQVDDYFEVSKNLDIFTQVYKEVNLSYVDEVKPGKLIREAIDGMLYSLDPYTNFYSEAQAEDYRFQVTGSYGGIGANIRNMNGKLVVARVFEGFPAQLADLRAGDILTQVDGKSVDGKSSSDLSDLLKGTAGTSVILTVDRPEIGEKNITVERATIKVKNVPYFGMIDNKMGYVKLVGFTPDAGKEVQDAVVQLKRDGAESIILDLRGNGGGLLHEAVNIVNVFVKKGQLIVSTRGKERENDRLYKTLNSPVDTEIPLVVLIDEGSASASEIVSGSIQDLDRGVVIGTKSFGKGLVQSTRMLTYNTQMKITTAKYYTPSGRCIQRLDYAHKQNGKAVIVADSLKHIFKTRNGREVTDGEGVTPDVAAGFSELSKIGQSLLRNDLIFDFATKYRNSHDAINDPKSFNLTSQDFQDFKNFLNGKDYSYETGTEKAIEALEKYSKVEEYHASMEANISVLKSTLKVNKNTDIDRHKTEIMNILETEVSSRYYFDRAMVESTFNYDPDIKSASELFMNRVKYAKILAGN